MTNQSGLVTLDFIFALVISFGMAAILFAMTFTLTVVEVTQYITFSAARAQAAANLDPATQEEAARKKYDQLVKNPVLASLYNSGWFEVSNRSTLEVKGGGNLGSFSSDYPSTDERKVFMGVRTKFTANVLDLKLPLIGKTADDEGGFVSRIAGILIREPSQIECQEFMKSRLENINRLDISRYGSFSSKKNFFPMEDNGC
jgi:hypothetical protein